MDDILIFNDKFTELINRANYMYDQLIPQNLKSMLNTYGDNIPSLDELIEFISDNNYSGITNQQMLDYILIKYIFKQYSEIEKELEEFKSLYEQFSPEEYKEVMEELLNGDQVLEYNQTKYLKELVEEKKKTLPIDNKDSQICNHLVFLSNIYDEIGNQSNTTSGNSIETIGRITKILNTMSTIDDITLRKSDAIHSVHDGNKKNSEDISKYNLPMIRYSDRTTKIVYVKVPTSKGVQQEIDSYFRTEESCIYLVLALRDCNNLGMSEGKMYREIISDIIKNNSEIENIAKIFKENNNITTCLEMINNGKNVVKFINEENEKK